MTIPLSALAADLFKRSGDDRSPEIIRCEGVNVLGQHVEVGAIPVDHADLPRHQHPADALAGADQPRWNPIQRREIERGEAPEFLGVNRNLRFSTAGTTRIRGNANRNIGGPMDTALLGLTSQIVSAFVSKNPIQATDLPALIKCVHQSLTTLGLPQETAEPAADLKPAVPVKKSVTPDYIVCLEDGKKLKMLKRHLQSSYGLTPDEYRAKWGLPADYPMVAPNYAKARSALAMEIGLGKRKTA